MGHRQLVLRGIKMMKYDLIYNPEIAFFMGENQLQEVRSIVEDFNNQINETTEEETITEQEERFWHLFEQLARKCGELSHEQLMEPAEYWDFGNDFYDVEERTYQKVDFGTYMYELEKFIYEKGSRLQVVKGRMGFTCRINVKCGQIYIVCGEQLYAIEATKRYERFSFVFKYL